MARDPERTRTLFELRGGQLHVQRFALVVRRGPDRGARLVSAGERVVIGSHRRADLVLADETVSRFHCELVVGRDAITVRDLESRNGTLINGVEIREALLRGPARLRIGGTELQFSLEDGAAEVELAEGEAFGGLVGRSPAMRALFATLARIAPSDATVLIQGETGTGKELVAEAIHAASLRAAGPLVVVDCASIPSHLIESELFGHEAGAFTGADRARIGAFERAAGGTLLFDEIGELPPEMQPRLLRGLEAGGVARIGGSAPIATDFRLLATTNRDLEIEVNAGRFRADLYYRLAVVKLRVPPLRARVGDLDVLVPHLLAALGATPEMAARIRREVARLADHAWPGNVRELRNHLERWATLASAPALAIEPAGDAPPPIDPAVPLRLARERWVRHFERGYVAALLAQHGGSVSEAARAAGITRVHLHRLIARERGP